MTGVRFLSFFLRMNVSTFTYSTLANAGVRGLAPASSFSLSLLTLATVRTVRLLYCSMRDADFDTKPRQPGQAVFIGSIPQLVSTSLSSLSQVCRQW